MNLIEELESQKLITPPKWLPHNLMYLVRMGSFAYGCSQDTSDSDVYGFAIPPKDVVFPHLAGEIHGFGKPAPKFDVWQQHHINYKENEYDFSVYGIVRFFQLVMENNPNMVDALFVPQNCIIHCTQIGNMVRDNRNDFLHAGCWHKFKGYAYNQLKMMRTREFKGSPKRAARVAEYGYDTKFAYHLVRLIMEVEEILTEGTLTLNRDGRREVLISIRNGEWTQEKIEQYFTDKERQLEEAYHNTKIPYKPQESKIKQLLLNCLEHHYGSLDKVINNPDKYYVATMKIKEILDDLD